MEELPKMNGKWMRPGDIENVRKKVGESLKWLMERKSLRDDETEQVQRNGEMEESEKSQVLGAKRTRSIAGVLEEVEVLIRNKPQLSGLIGPLVLFARVSPFLGLQPS